MSWKEWLCSQAMQVLNSMHMHTANVQFKALYIMEDLNEQNSELYLHFMKNLNVDQGTRAASTADSDTGC